MDLKSISCQKGHSIVWTSRSTRISSGTSTGLGMTRRLEVLVWVFVMMFLSMLEELRSRRMSLWSNKRHKIFCWDDHEREARAIFTNADNGDYLCTIRSQDGRRVVDFCAARGQHPRNRQHARGVDGGFPSHHLKGEGPTH